MSAEDVALIRAVLRAPSPGAFYEALDPEVEWDVTRDPGAARVIRGRESVREFMGRWRRGWEHWRFEEEDFHDAGDRVVTIAGGDDPGPAQRPAAVWSVRGGRVVRFVWYERADDALRDAGLAPPPA